MPRGYRSGLDTIRDEKVFMERLKKMYRLKPSSKKHRLYQINRAEEVMQYDHYYKNIEIEERDKLKQEWIRENPDGEYQE